MNQALGFTLIELLVAMVLASILLAIAVPSYVDYIRESRRSDATSQLLGIVSAEEGYRQKNLTYGTLAQVWGGVSVTPQGYYNLSISNNTATGFTVTATATTSGGQANDHESTTNCGTLTITVSGLTTTKTPTVCW